MSCLRIFITLPVSLLALKPSSTGYLRHRESNDPWWVDGSSLSVTPSDMLCALKDAVAESASGVQSMSFPSGQRLPHVGTCAVVGSSGVMRLHDHGKAIDAADMVLRFNAAPLRGFERHVGTKDTMRLVNERVLDEWIHGENVDLLKEGTIYATSCTVCNVGSAHTVSPAAFEQRQAALLLMYPNIELFSTDLRLESSLEHFFEEFYGVLQSNAGVTTGGVGMILALSMCDEVLVYGMAASVNDVPSVPYSYWESADAPDGNHQTQAWHASFTAEKDLWRQLATNPLTEVDASDVAIIPGFSKANCPARVEGGLV